LNLTFFEKSSDILCPKSLTYSSYYHSVNQIITNR